MPAYEYSAAQKNDVLVLLDKGLSQREVEAITDVPPRTQRRWKRAFDKRDREESAGGEPTLNGLVDVDTLVDKLMEHPELASAEGQRAMVRYAMGVLLEAGVVGALSGEMTPGEARRLMKTLTRWHREVESAADDGADPEDYQPIFEDILEAVRISEYNASDIQTRKERHDSLEYLKNHPKMAKKLQQDEDSG